MKIVAISLMSIHLIVLFSVDRVSAQTLQSDEFDGSGQALQSFWQVLPTDRETLSSGVNRNNRVWLWDAVMWEHKATIKGHTSEVHSVAFSPDGETLASGSLDNTVQLWDAATGEYKAILRGPSGWVESVAFSSDGSTFAMGIADHQRGSHGRNSAVVVWDAATWEHKATITEHTAYVVSVALSPDGATVASGSVDSLLLLSDAATGQEKARFTEDVGGVYSLAFSPDGKMLASGIDRKVVLRDIKTGETKRKLLKSVVRSVAFSPDGKTLASGSGGVQLWDVAKWQHKTTITDTGGVWSVAFSPDGKMLASGSSDNTVRLWDATTGEHKTTITGHTGWVRSVAFSPDGKTLASGSSDNTVRLWELTSSATVNTVVSLSPPSVQSPAIGQPLTLSLNIADGQNVAGYQATVGFDTSALRYVSSDNGGYLPAGAFTLPAIVSGNKVTLAATTLAGESDGDGTLAVLTFEVVAVKASTLTLSEVILSDSVGKESRPRVEDGQVTEPRQLEADVNGDNVVNILDLLFVVSNFGKTGQNEADVNGDDVVNIVDLVLVAGALGNAVAAPSTNPQALAMLTAADVQGWLTQAQDLVLTDATLQRGIIFLEQLLAALPPKETALLPNYPNPFNPETWIPYHLAHAADVTLTIYDTKGAPVRRLELGHQPAGYYTNRTKAAYWNGCNDSGESIASGVYFYQFRAGDYTAVRRMVILK